MKAQHVFTPWHCRGILSDKDYALRILQERLMEWTGKRRCVLCSSGSAALYLGLRAMSASSVVIPASTFPAIREAASLAGLQADSIVMADANDATWHMLIGFGGCGAVYCPAHNYGCVGDHRTSDLSCSLIDAAAALLTPGAFSHGTAFAVSFNWNKSISGGGGGALLTDHDAIADRAEGLKRHDGAGAFNFQCPQLCAAEAYDQMACAPSRQLMLQELTQAYDEHLARVGLHAYPYGTHRWLTGTLLPSARHVAAVASALKERGYATRPPWKPLADLPGATEIHERGLMLPGGYSITPEHVREVCDVVGGAIA